MQRWDIINHLIKKNNYKSYLEIGYYKGWSYERVYATYMVAVDPNPCRTPEEELMNYGDKWETLIQGKDGVVGHTSNLFKLTSDEYFEKVDLQQKFDIIFIDGLHKSEQADKDIENSLKHLSPGGCIVMHDCNPPTLLHATTGVPDTGEWCGDVYKSFIKFRCREYEGPGMSKSAYVVDTDYGVGVITDRKPGELVWTFGKEFIEECENWEYFNKNREHLLALVSVERFLEWEKI